MKIIAAKGAYVLHLELLEAALLKIGSLGDRILPPGRYLYAGSARSGIEARVARHKRLADSKAGRVHWHVDYLLVHPQCRLVRTDVLPGRDECGVSQQIAGQDGVSVPVPGFGSSDCRSGCRAHLYHVRKPRALRRVWASGAPSSTQERQHGSTAEVAENPRKSGGRNLVRSRRS